MNKEDVLRVKKFIGDFRYDQHLLKLLELKEITKKEYLELSK